MCVTDDFKLNPTRILTKMTAMIYNRPKLLIYPVHVFLNTVVLYFKKTLVISFFTVHPAGTVISKFLLSR